MILLKAVHTLELLLKVYSYIFICTYELQRYPVYVPSTNLVRSKCVIQVARTVHLGLLVTTGSLY